MRYAPVTATAAALLLAPIPTYAGGEFYGRTADAASIRSCEGRLVEQLHEGGNIHGFDSILLLACMQSTTDASWVLLSGTSCSDGSDKPTRCDGRIVRAVPRFIVDENFWQAKDTPNTSYPMLYNLLKFGVGENCRINSQQYEARGIYNHSEVDKYWHCDKLSVQDRIDDFPRGKWKPFRLTTNSRKPIDVMKVDDPSNIFGTHFVLPESAYTLHIEDYR
jgi:hypothetical protein